MNKLLAILILLLAEGLHTQAQKLEWSFDFRGIGDNREFTPIYGSPQTIIGERSSLELGTTLDSKHRLRVALTHFHEFGTDITFNKPQITAYYRYDDSKTQFYFGAFPRYNLINFPLAFLSDTISYYQPNIEGLLAQHDWGWGNQLIFVDWTGKKLRDQREKFIAATSGCMHFKQFYLENFLLLYHYALMEGHDEAQHIIDNSAANINLGYRLPDAGFLQQSYLEAGFLTSQYRERNVSNGFHYSTSFFSTIFLQHKKLAIRNTLSLGAAHRLMLGDGYYAAKDYMRTDFIIHLINHRQVKLTFNLSFHLANWHDFDNQQQLSLIYRLSNS